jgi:tRNA(Ile)-lysidine synthase
VDHGLRAESAQEAQFVADFARHLGVSHATLHWKDWTGTGNLQDQARQARHRLLTGWAAERDIPIVALGHTADDQAETVLMRLARGSGVTGLAGMSARRPLNGITLVRPLLDQGRAALRTYLTEQGIAWIDDPSNQDTSFDRIKARQAMAALGPLGLTVQTFGQIAANMAQARDALDWYTFLAARDCVTIDGGDVVLDRRSFRILPEEIARRLFVRAVMWINGVAYPPRRGAVTGALAAIRQGKSATLAGCQSVVQPNTIWICREFDPVRRLRVPASQTWDRRWRMYGRGAAGCEIRALGRRGLMECADWRGTGRPRAALIASPAVWNGEGLVAAPLAGLSAGWQADLVGGSDEFFASLLSH